MKKYYLQISVIILAVVIVAACTSAPAPAPTSSMAPPAPTLTLTMAPLTPTVVVPSPTNLPATDLPPTIPPPTVVPPTEASPTVEVEIDPTQDNLDRMESDKMNIKIGDRVLTATLVDNSSVDALKSALLAGPITVNMRDYGRMEKVGSLGMDLPRNDTAITTEAGDIILYQGSALVIYYAPNSWDFTRLGKIENVTAQELKDILGAGDVTVTLSLP